MERRRILSGSDGGRPVIVSTTSSPGVLVHEANAGHGKQSLVRLFATNIDTSAVELSIELGGTAHPGDRIIVTVPAKSGLFEVVPGLPLDNGFEIRALADSANKILISGYVEVVAAK